MYRSYHASWLYQWRVRESCFKRSSIPSCNTCGLPHLDLRCRLAPRRTTITTLDACSLRPHAVHYLCLPTCSTPHCCLSKSKTEKLMPTAIGPLMKFRLIPLNKPRNPSVWWTCRNIGSIPLGPWWWWLSTKPAVWSRRRTTSSGYTTVEEQGNEHRKQSESGGATLRQSPPRRRGKQRDTYSTAQPTRPHHQTPNVRRLTDCALCGLEKSVGTSVRCEARRAQAQA